MDPVVVLIDHIYVIAEASDFSSQAQVSRCKLLMEVTELLSTLTSEPSIQYECCTLAFSKKGDLNTKIFFFGTKAQSAILTL